MGLINDAAKVLIETGKGSIEKANQRKQVQNGVTDYNNNGKTSIFEKIKSELAKKAYPAEAKYQKTMKNFEVTTDLQKAQKELETMKKAMDKPLTPSEPKLSN